MADLHNALTRGGLSQALKNALGLTKDPGGIERYGETLTPTINLWSRPEWQFLRNETLWVAFRGSAAVAAEFSFSAVVNPPNNQQLVVVEAVSFRGAVAAVQLGITTRAIIAATGTQGANATNRDTRVAGVSLAIVGVNVETWTGSDPGNTLGGNSEEGIPITEYQSFTTVPYVLKPGTGLYVIGQTVNLSIQVNFAGYVRAAARGELVA